MPLSNDVLGKSKESREPARVERGERALDFMEQQLAGRTFLVGDALSIADVSLFAYTQVADEGGFELGRRPHVQAWLRRCQKELGLPVRPV